MSKRFTDSEKWKDAWFMDLPSKYKLLWIYLLDECDIAGIWKVNFKVAQFYVGEHLEPSEVKRVFNTRINFVNDEYWYIEGFVKFQQNKDVNELNPDNNAHKGIIDRLQVRGLLGAKEGLASPPSKSKSKSNSNSKDEISKNEIPINFLKTGIAKEQAHMAIRAALPKLNDIGYLNLLEDYYTQAVGTAKVWINKRDTQAHFVRWASLRKWEDVRQPAEKLRYKPMPE